MGKWYGSLENRLEENQMFTDEIKVGTGVTEYFWSDREPHEVIAVRDQKHVTIRAMGHRHIGDGCMDNNWEIFSNPDGAVRDLVKRGKYWYSTRTWSAEDIDLIDQMDGDRRLQYRLAMAHDGIDPEVLRERGKITRYHRVSISFGRADYYYDYSF